MAGKFVVQHATSVPFYQQKGNDYDKSNAREKTEFYSKRRELKQFCQRLSRQAQAETVTEVKNG
ncbi:MAG: hypothetical protein ACK42Y_05645, partial [Candidatus Thermochlorobacter sp.]